MAPSSKSGSGKRDFFKQFTRKGQDAPETSTASTAQASQLPFRDGSQETADTHLQHDVVTNEPLASSGPHSKNAESSRNTPCWDEAVVSLRAHNPKIHDLLEEQGRIAIDANPEALFPQNSTSPWLMKAKRWLPILKTVKAVAMTAAAQDPHKGAPLAVAAAFLPFEVRRHCRVLLDSNHTMSSRWSWRPA
jgi:hypothetical protein